jgi:hypothetical protein
MIDKILNANDFAQSKGFTTSQDMLRAHDYRSYDTPYVDVEPEGDPVVAFISFGFWIAECECRGAEYVAPGQPFYCMSCGNYAAGGKPRPVIFPENMQAIEAEILRRPVTQGTGRNQFERAQRSRAVVSTERGWLSRTWQPGETIEDLKAQNKNLPSRRRR